MTYASDVTVTDSRYQNIYSYLKQALLLYQHYSYQKKSFYRDRGNYLPFQMVELIRH